MKSTTYTKLYKRAALTFTLIIVTTSTLSSNIRTMDPKIIIIICSHYRLHKYNLIIGFWQQMAIRKLYKAFIIHHYSR